MENCMSHLCGLFLDRWQAATSFQYCVLSVVIIVCGWLMSRTASRPGY